MKSLKSRIKNPACKERHLSLKQKIFLQSCLPLFDFHQLACNINYMFSVSIIIINPAPVRPVNYFSSVSLHFSCLYNCQHILTAICFAALIRPVFALTTVSYGTKYQLQLQLLSPRAVMFQLVIARGWAAHVCNGTKFSAALFNKAVLHTEVFHTAVYIIAVFYTVDFQTAVLQILMLQFSFMYFFMLQFSYLQFSILKF